MENVILSTGDIKKDYEIIDVIFAQAGIHNPYFAGPQYNESFDELKKILKQKCAEIGGNAVINVRFEYQHTKNNIHELFSYGTCVKFK